MNDKLQQVGRVAFRVEGNLWNAYYAETDTMDGAIFLGSIAFGAVAESPARKQAFMDLMRDVVTEIIQSGTGLRPTWGGPNTAPEHERGGNV